jgi:hypothetical protein
MFTEAALQQLTNDRRAQRLAEADAERLARRLAVADRPSRARRLPAFGRWLIARQPAG